MEASLLAARELRVDAHGAAVVDGLTFATSAGRARVAIVGAGRALFEATCGVARPARGAIEVRGEAASAALAAGRVAGAPLDPPLPAEWSPLDHATWSARLAGLAAGDARTRASWALTQLGVTSDFASVRLDKSTIPARRATVIAGAIATGAPVIAFEDPTPGLSDEAAHVVSSLLVATLEAAGVSAWIAFATRAPLDSPWVQAVDEALVIAGSSVVAQGKPGSIAWGPRRYAVDAQGQGELLTKRLIEGGARVDHVVTAPGWARFVVELREGGTPRDLFDAADAVGAVVVELRPVGLAFA